MYINPPISMRVLLRVLCITVVSCILISDVTAQLFPRNRPQTAPVQRPPVQRPPVQEAPSQSTQLPAVNTQTPTRASNEQLPDSPLYSSLLHERHMLQASIERAIFSYRQTRINVYEGRKELERYLGDRHYDTAVKIAFLNALTREENSTQRQAPGIAPELAVAYSYWRENLNPHESHLEQLSEDINRLLDSRMLERMLEEVRHMENRENRPPGVDEQYQDKISTLIAESRVARGGLDSDLIMRITTGERLGRLSDDTSDEEFTEP